MITFVTFRVQVQRKGGALRHASDELREDPQLRQLADSEEGRRATRLEPALLSGDVLVMLPSVSTHPCAGRA